ncbi:integrase [Vibrio ishigakensis]|uniref:Integrase n=1 Tax=Vibrio ishigakensis TaxID=1481914 RepID=A0A0B8QSX3_9VIBR|nr:integrase [Vibrio ishigakensis]
MQLRCLQEELTGSHLAGGQVLNWGTFPALAWVNDIYPGTDSPAQKSDQWLVEVGVTPKSIYVYHLTNFFELMRTAQKAFLLADLETVKVILSRLEVLSDSSYQLETAVVADALVKQVQRPKKKSRSKYNLQKALKAYQEDKRIIRGINSQSNSSTKIESELRREEGRCRVVHQLVGIDDITKLSRKDVIKAIELLSQFPVVPHQSKFRTRFDKLPLEKWIDLGRELGLKTMSHRTIFAYVSAASAFYEWANRHIDSQIGNPWRGVIKKRKSGQNQLHERNPFSIEQLRVLFSQEPFIKGEKGLRRRNRKRLCYQYWLPLIALHTGLRANEIAQLYRSDIKSRDGIVYFDLTSSRPDQSLKNSGAVRIVPVHSKLLELGFVEYLDRFSSEQRIFPELSFTGRDGYFKSAGEWFRRFLRDTLSESDKVSFYSFRHTFADSFKQ